MAANQDLVAIITELYNNVGGPGGYNHYCMAMGMLETIKAKCNDFDLFFSDCIFLTYWFF